MILGHNHPAILRAILEQAPRGLHYSACHELELRWSELIRSIVPGAERVRFTMTGTETTALAIRVARAATGRSRIIKFRGHEEAAGSGPRTEEAFGVRNPKIYYTSQIKLTATLSSKLLVDAGWSTNNETYTTYELEPSALKAGGPIPRTDIILQTTWGAPTASFFLHVPIRRTWGTSLSYVTGSHALKTGIQWGYGWNRSQKRFMQQGPDAGFGVDLVQRYRNGVPDSQPRRPQLSGSCG